MIPRLTTTRPDDDERWRCSGCGAKYGLDVVRTEHDEDGYPIRIRKCRNCKVAFATEETPIPLAQFYPRAKTHTENNTRSNLRKWLVCKRCTTAYGQPPKARTMFIRHHSVYRYGSFRAHVNTRWHQATLRNPSTVESRAKEAQRRRKQYWRKRGVDLDTAGTSNALRDIDESRDPLRLITPIAMVPD